MYNCTVARRKLDSSLELNRLFYWIIEPSSITEGIYNGVSHMNLQ